VKATNLPGQAQIGPADSKRRPSSRTLDPSRFRHLDQDKPMPTRQYDLGLRQWNLGPGPRPLATD
jgi:hypothetical protein